MGRSNFQESFFSAWKTASPPGHPRCGCPSGADECPCRKIQIYVQENFFCISPFMEAKEEKSPFYFFFSKIMQKFFYLFFSSFCGVVKKIILTPLKWREKNIDFVICLKI
jgi:hypothetical protein